MVDRFRVDPREAWLRVAKGITDLSLSREDLHRNRYYTNYSPERASKMVERWGSLLQQARFPFLDQGEGVLR
jgi:hypothetical protein